jgi:hypothetical protein
MLMSPPHPRDRPPGRRGVMVWNERGDSGCAPQTEVSRHELVILPFPFSFPLSLSLFCVTCVTLNDHNAMDLFFFCVSESLM